MKIKDVEKFLSINFNTEYRALTGETKTRVNLELDIPVIKAGILKEIYKEAGGNGTHLLLAIASYMDENGKCYPTQRQIADITGMALSTVNRVVSKLMNVKINDKPIIERKFIGTGNKQSTVYYFKTVGSAVKDEAPSQVDEKMNSKDIINLFVKLYKEQFGVAYNVNWGKDGKLVKTKLLPNFTDDQIKTMIEIAIQNYEEKWSNAKYPRPTISMVCGWLGNKALTMAEQQNKQEKEFEEIMEFTANADDDLDDLLTKFQ